MTEKFVLREHYIPDGILHDQDLYEVKLENNELTLSFEISCFEDYIASVAEKYKDFTKCHIKCRFEEDKYFGPEVELKALRNKKGIYKVKVMSISEFVEIANKEIAYRKKKGYWPWEYLATGVSPNFRCVQIDFSIWIKYKGTVYHNCSINLDTEEIEFIWE